LITGFKIGDKVQSVNSQCAIPELHLIKNLTGEGYKPVGDFPVIYLVDLNLGNEGLPSWIINTGMNCSSGLVCFLPKAFLYTPVFEVEITKISEKSVTAIPTSWLWTQTGLLEQLDLYTGDSLDFLTKIEELKDCWIKH
jgi:hypothetical protein